MAGSTRGRCDDAERGAWGVERGGGVSEERYPATVLRPTPHAPRPTPFDRLCAEAAECRRCPAMAGRRRVLSRANGSPGALVLFIGEAPGRLGGERTGIPFSGDQTGRDF